ncbi:low molecular weight protein tyrosine phosphatase family protein [Hymenobacter volaticus]|uniref:Protein tyrosine phosphatase n=1 Tax=Hymenobacter volaticus TaxID=2932254 RepID=A0ABY4G154_9BACT|nr:protein tyrosine phosphatase [Hymenobacter volaticus]UOQ64566.1 protein tyrosine phosphatase [Hymenobacter volaticus]
MPTSFGLYKSTTPLPTVPADATQLLFICSQNRWRSLTAERLFDGHSHYAARSAGTEPGARVRVTAGHVGWADVVFVMERKHADILQAKFKEELAGKPIINLRIPDKFQFLDAVLQDLLRERLTEHLKEL